MSFWLIENNFRVLIAACDTFRAGAVEQLRTHTHHLNALHSPDRHGGQTMVQLYEQVSVASSTPRHLFWSHTVLGISVPDELRFIYGLFLFL